MVTKKMLHKQRFTAIDLFSGPGGMSEGFSKAGFKVICALDTNKLAAKSYKINHKYTVFINEKIEDVQSEKILDIAFNKGYDTIDLIMGGPPCQGFSMANMRSRTLDNPKNSLPHHFIRLVRDIKPKYFVMENVPGLLTLAKGEIKDKFIGEFRKIGYHVEYRVLNSVYYGVPQKRERVFFIGSRENKHPIFFPPHITLPPGQTSFSNFKPFVTVWDAISDLPRIGDGGGGRNIDVYHSKPKNYYQKMMREGRTAPNSKLFNHVSTRSSEGVVERFKHIPPGGNWAYIPEKLLKTNGKYKRLDRTHSHIYRRLHPDKPAPTIANFRKAMLQHPYENRILSVREAARLQSFPDGYIFQGGISSMQQQVADAVPVLLAEAVARTLIDALSKGRK